MHPQQDMADLTESLLAEAFKDEEQLKKASVQISQEITSNKYNIAVFVEKLGFALTSPSIEFRVRGTQLLSYTLLQLPRDFLTSTQLEFIATFFADRMKDQHSVIPAVLDGVAAITVMKNFPDASVVTLLQSFSQNIVCQSQVKSDREKIFNIYFSLTENFENVLKTMGGDFIYGFISCLDGERDPRILELIFLRMPDFIRKFHLLHLYEEMFEIFACYFPIDFNPSKTDPAAITRDNLATKLANILVATEQFSEWTIALALEKLESDLIVAKLDSLQLLNLSAQNFSPETIQQHFEPIWSALKAEIFPGPDNQDIINTGLKTLKSILERACSNPKISHCHQTIILGTILPHLNDVNQRLFHPSATIALVCVSGDAAFATEKILHSFLLKLNSKEEDLKSQDKLKIFYILAQVFKICSTKNLIRQIKSEVTSELHDLFLKEMKQPNNSMDLKKASLGCLDASLQAVSEIHRALLYQSLVEVLAMEGVEIDLKDILQHLAELYPVELQSHCIEKCVVDFSELSAFVKRKIYQNLLHLVKYKAFTQTVYDLIFNNIFLNENPDVQVIALDALIALFEAETAAFIEELHMNQSLIDKVIKLVQNGGLNYKVLERCATVLSLIMKNLPISEQYMIASEYLQNLNLQLESDLFIVKGILGFLHPDISIDDHFERIINDLTVLSLKSDNESIRKVAHHLLCSLFNKMDENEVNRNVLQRILAKLYEEIKHNNEKAVEILSWIGKGLNVRGHDVAGEIIEAIAELLDHPTLSSAANLGFDIISAEYPQIHLPAVKFLFKQKFFNIVLSKMGAMLKSFSGNHLNAFIYVLKTTPHAVLRMNIEQIGPVVFKCLESNRVQTVRIALEICENFIKDKDLYFSGHLNHLVPQCLKLAQYKQSMNVRITALNLLYEISRYPAFVLLPLKMDVVLGIAPALDDQKRLVRLAAVRASNAWHLVGEPNGD